MNAPSPDSDVIPEALKNYRFSTKPTAVFEIERCVDGTALYKPVNEAAGLFARIADRLLLVDADIDRIKKLGFNIITNARGKK